MYKRNRPTFNELVRVSLLLSDMTESELAVESDVTIQTIVNIVSKNKKVSRRTQIKVLSALGLKTDIITKLC